MKKVLILFGGNSFEHNISCLSAASIMKNIDMKKFDVTCVGISKDNNWYLFDGDISCLENSTWLDISKKNKINNIIFFVKQFDVVFPITHGNNGEDGKLQGFFDLFDIRYVGSKTLGSAIGMDKSLSKLVFNSLQIPQVPYFVTNKKCTNITSLLSYPVIVKPSNGGSSIGISIANNKKQLKKAISIASKFDEKVIVEQFIKARELECSVLKTNKIHVSSIGEISSSNLFYDYCSKYENDNSKLIIPAKIPTYIEKRIKKYAEDIFLAFECKNLARIDFFYDESNDKVYINEINTLPGFTKISMFPKLIEKDGIDYKKIITLLINNA